MKNNISIALFVTSMITLGIMACTKMTTNPYFSNGKTPVLSLSTTTIVPTPGDSSNNVLMLSWTNPRYATDSATELYTIQIDSSGRNFSKAVNIPVSGALGDTFTAKQINTIALGFGFSYNVAYHMDVRLISSYANNNEQITSNMITISYTPYVIPPKIPPPAYLYMIGDAVITAPGNSWNMPIDTPYQKFTRIDSVTFGGIFNITGGNSYLLLPVASTYNNKYAVVDNTVAGASASGSFQAYTSGGDNFPAPAASGWYTIVVNFQTATYTVTPYTGPTVPLAITPTPSTLQTGLWIIGDATPQNPSWTNDPVSLASQQFAQPTNGDFQISIALTTTGSYLFLPAAGDWNNKYGGASATGGPILFDNSVPGSNTPPPAASGNYLVDVNFVTGNYKVTGP
jgi:hypothetical protein